MTAARRAPRAPWIIAAVAGVLVIALVIVYVSVLPSYRKSHAVGQFGGRERAALAAASTETANLLTFSRANFAADYARALAGATGSLKSDIASKKSSTQSTLTQGKFDLTAHVTHEALVGPSGASAYVLLITINGYKSTDPNVPTQQNLQVTVQDVKGHWLISDVENVGIS